MATPPPSSASVSGSPLFRLRPGRRGDSEGLGLLLRELGYAEGVDSATMNWVISHPETEIHVATDLQDRPVGLLTMSHRPQLRLRGRVATIDELIVSLPWRRKGVARALVRRAMDRAKALSVKRLELRNHAPDVDGAVAHFAQACGFSATGTTAYAFVP